MIQNLAALRRLPLFRDLTPKELASLREHLTWCRFDPGDTLFREGDPAPSCYVIASGDIDVFTRLDDGRKQKLATLGPGALVGVMALIDHKPRSATCQVGLQPARLIEMKRADFDRLLYARSPFAYKILDRVALDLVERLRGATARLTDRAGETADRAQRAAEALMGQGSGRMGDDFALDSVEIEVVETAVDQRYPRRR